MVEVICDTSFLIHIATRQIKNINNLETEIGQIQFVVPQIVINELKILSQNNTKKKEASYTLNFIKNHKKISLTGKTADDALVSYIKDKGGMIATMDIDLKKKIKNLGGSIMSVSNDKIVLETSKI